MKKIGCLHAHHSNIEHIEEALRPYDVELVHFVDPGLDRRKLDADFNDEMAEKKVKETLDWIAGCRVDAIMITCTFFTAVYREELHPCPVPVIKIDVPLFQDIVLRNEPSLLVFTNPNTVKGTLEQFNAFSKRAGTDIPVETRLLDHTFELIMQGKKEQYIALVTEGLLQIAAENPDKLVAAAQLSMVPAARQAGKIMERWIGNPLDSLIRFMEETLSLQRKSEK
ncbi:hypothetical protein O9H85_12445 [Paenibacillus filicis]|uniref:Asp/Glu racemase n=1 Tax=Paenibacillus gyeongsangnamensis TaxID=3388067 RepID=A0ABT4Q8L9_9BACL|nr:hypothetical protein [Paenibacillus filicis]MCZ8513221.1 hypothetical protein [Paenibacillus filicis]